MRRLRLPHILSAAYVFVAAVAVAQLVPHSLDGPVLWTPPGFDASQVASVNRNEDRSIAIVVAPDHIYQHAFVSGASLDGGMVDIEYVEFTVRSLGTGASHAIGWRNPFRVSRYVQPVFDDEAPATAGRRAGVVQVFCDGENYLIVVTRFRAASLPTP